jgi:hypothetical protein
MTAVLAEAFKGPEQVAKAKELYAQLDALAQAEVDDPRVDEAVRLLTDLIPRDMLPEAGIDHGDSFLRALYADFAPAQAEAIRRALRIVAGEQR